MNAGEVMLKILCHLCVLLYAVKSILMVSFMYLIGISAGDTEIICMIIYDFVKFY